MIAGRWTYATLGLLGRHATLLLFAGVFLGIALPPLAAFMKPLFLPSVVLLLALSLLRLETRDVVAIGRRPTLLALVYLWLLILSPLAMTGLLFVIDLPAQLEAGLVLCAACPPIMSSIAFALMFRLDAALVTVLVFATILAAPLTLPPLALALIGLELQIDLLEFMLRLAAITGGSIIIAATIRFLIPKPRIDAAAQPLDGIAVILMLIFGIAIMDGVGVRIVADTGLVMLTLAMAVVANLGLQIAATGLFWPAGRRTALSIGLTSGNRNMGLLLAALAGTAHPDVVLFIAMYQLPIFMLPLAMKPLYGRLSGSAASSAVSRADPGPPGSKP